MKKLNFPDSAPLWQQVEQDYNDRTDNSIPLMVSQEAQNEAQNLINPPKEPTNAEMEQESIDMENAYNNAPNVDLSGPIQHGVVESGQVSQADFDATRGNAAPQNEYEKLQAKMQELRDLEAAQNETAGKYNFGAKAAAILGDTLARYNTGGIQKNVKAPIQYTGPKLQEMMSIIGEVKAPGTKDQRAELLKEYELLKKAQGGDLSEYQKQSLELRKKQIEATSKGLDLRSDKFEHAKKEKDEISDKQADALDAYDQTLASLARTGEMKQDIDTGPLSDTRNKIASALGIDDPKVTALRSQTIDTLAERIKALSGTAASEPEAARLRVTLPALKDSDVVFNEKLKNAENRIKEAREIRLQSYTKQGKSISSFQDVSKPTSIQKVTIQAPSGKTMDVSPQNAEEYLKRPGYSKVK